MVTSELRWKEGRDAKIGGTALPARTTGAKALRQRSSVGDQLWLTDPVGNGVGERRLGFIFIGGF